MLTSIALDALLTLIILMMVPLGLLRGGLREVCTSAGLLLGILMAQAWSGRWFSGLVTLFNMSESGARFTMAVIIVVIVTAIAGYGGSASFSWRPGPGGRMYGAYLALLNAVLFVGFLINAYIDALFDGQVPETIDQAWVSKALSVGFEWVLLAGAIGVLGATLFGMVVRERGDEQESVTTAPSAEEFFRVRHEQSAPQVRPLNEPEDEPSARPAPSGPVRIREVRHWEEQPESQPESRYGTGWRQTWPDDRKTPVRPPAPGTSSRDRSTDRARSGQDSGRQRDVLRDWMRTDKESREES